MPEKIIAQLQTPQEDLAFMKALVSDGGRTTAATGALFVVAGLVYGVQCLLQWAQLAGFIDWGPLGNLIVGIGPTLIFITALCYGLWRDRKTTPSGVATRALNAAFSAAGLANLFMTLVFGYVAWRNRMWLIWMLYPVVVCAFQGAVWSIAYMIRRKLWMAAVSAGWFGSTLLLGLMIGSNLYVAALGLILIVLMAGPGYVMVRQAKDRS